MVTVQLRLMLDQHRIACQALPGPIHDRMQLLQRLQLLQAEGYLVHQQSKLKEVDYLAKNQQQQEVSLVKQVNNFLLLFNFNCIFIL